MPENTINIQIADWEKDNEPLKSIRRQVFIEEQKVPEDMEWDEDDSSSTHFLVWLNNKTIATARLKKDGQIGRMAVLSAYRNHGTGSQLLQFILHTAAQQNISKVYLHAQVSAIAFYKKHGFSANGEIFYEANIPHREMLKNIC